MKRILTTIAVIAISVILVAGCQNATTMPEGLSNDQLKDATMKALAINVSLNGLNIDAGPTSITFTSQTLTGTLDRLTNILHFYGYIQASDVQNSATWIVKTIFGTMDAPTNFEIANATKYEVETVQVWMSDLYHYYDRSEPVVTYYYYSVTDPRTGLSHWELLLDEDGQPTQSGIKLFLSGGPWDRGFDTWVDQNMADRYGPVGPAISEQVEQTIESEGDSYVKLSGTPIQVEFWLDGILQYKSVISSEYITVNVKDSEGNETSVPDYSLFAYRIITRDMVQNAEISNEIVDPQDVALNVVEWFEELMQDDTHTDPVPTP